MLAGFRAGFCRGAAVHLGLHVASAWCGAVPRATDRELRGDHAWVRTAPRKFGRTLVAALPRHGSDRRNPDSAGRRHTGDIDVAHLISAAPGVLAAGDLTFPCNDHRWSELRL